MWERRRGWGTTRPPSSPRARVGGGGGGGRGKWEICMQFTFSLFSLHCISLSALSLWEVKSVSFHFLAHWPLYNYLTFTAIMYTKREGNMCNTQILLLLVRKKNILLLCFSSLTNNQTLTDQLWVTSAISLLALSERERSRGKAFNFSKQFTEKVNEKDNYTLCELFLTQIQE